MTSLCFAALATDHFSTRESVANVGNGDTIGGTLGFALCVHSHLIDHIPNFWSWNTYDRESDGTRRIR